MAGSALIFQKGHYLFGNADQNSLANQNGLGNQLLQNHEQRQQELNERRNANDGVFVSEETDLAKKRRGRPKYDTDKFLLKENGLDRIEKDCKDWKFKGKGHERSDLKKLIKLYREWAIQMYPSMRFEDLVRKTVTFSSQYKVKNHLQKLRDQRDGVQVFGDEVKEEDEDMDLDIQMDNNNEDRPQRQLQREADEDAPQANPPQNDRNTNNNNDYARNSELGAVLEARGNRVNNAVNDNNNNTNNANPNGNYNDRNLNFGGDPMDMMDFGPPPDEYDMDREIARAMYG
eukprot:147072_1